MTQSFTSDDLQALAAFPFKDAGWKNKFLIGSLIIFLSYIIPIAPLLAVYGYCAQILRRIVLEDSDPFLPEWDDFGKLLSDGLKPLGAILIYHLPVILLFIVGFTIFFSTFFVTSFMAALTADAPNETPPAALGLIPLLGSLIFMVTLFMTIILSLLASVISPAAAAHVIVTDEFAAAFRWREWGAILRANWGGFLLAYAILLVFWVVFSFVLQILYFTIIGCCFLPFLLPPVTFYTLVVASSLFARAYRVGLEKDEAVAQSGHAPNDP